MKKARLLIVDDSALVREILARGLGMDSSIDVVGTAADPYKARDLIVKLKPNVLTLDVEMPRMDGLEFLRKLMPQYPLPVLMVSSLTKSGSQITLNALESGAIDFVLKPSTDIKAGLSGMMEELREKVKMAAAVDVSKWKKNASDLKRKKPVTIKSLAKTTDKVIAIGASTGGTEALRKVLTALPANTPGIVVVQHMPAGFTKMFADRLNTLSELEIKEAKSGDRVMTGHALIAAGDYHLQIIRSGGTYRVVSRNGAKVCGHRPSVDVLFRSVAKYAASNAIGVMLTGMGADGADAMVKMRNAGARTVAQDEATSVVFGMPKEAYKRGGAELLKPLDKIPEMIKKYLEGMD
ncbi:MAG: chemotaxis response regulator protein-glutamate methylesterase [Calditrichales bacterium]|nr:chemotaxis response regulator protein-glutamate methylesterase [Calditrichales bacterium]